MKKGDADVFVPEGAEDEASEDEAEVGGTDTLLGNAFDAFQDGDREGFIKSLKAAIGSGE